MDNFDFPLPAAEEVQIPQQFRQQPSAQQLKDQLCLYPVYIDAAKTMAQGRKVPADVAVKDPAVFYMHEALRQLGYAPIIEPDKRHPRDPFTYGRVRVLLKKNVGSIKSKKKLLIEMAKLMPKCKETLDAEDPNVKIYAANSRSELSKVIEQVSKISVTEEAGPPNKKNKKKGRK